MTEDPAPIAPPPDSNPTTAKPPARRRTFLKWFGVAIVLLLVAAIGAILSVDYWGRWAIEAAGARALGVTTTLDQLSIGIRSGKSSLNGFQVANPEGFKSGYFLRLDSGSLDMSLANVLQETIEIEQLELSGIHLNLAREGKQTNVTTILANIRRLEEERGHPAGADHAGGKHFVIHSVLIRDVHVNVNMLPLGGKLTQLDIPIELLELKNVGAESARGENLAKVIATIVRALLEAVLAKGDALLPPETMEQLKDKLWELKPLETLRSLQDSLKKRREQRKQNDGAEPERRPLFPRRQNRQETE